MKYPIKCNYIEYRKCPDNSNYMVKNYLSDQVVEISQADVDFIEKMDGKTDPMTLLRKDMSVTRANAYLMDLQHKELIRLNKTLFSMFGCFMRTLIIFRDGSKFRKQARIFNNLLIISIVPAILLGCINAISVIKVFLDGMIFFNDLLFYSGMVAGVIFGGLFHEFAHAAASISYGGRVMEIGIMFKGFPGAYTMMDCSMIRKRLHRIQIDCAGIELNIVFAGLAIVLCRFCPVLFSFLFEFAFLNIEFALTNLLFIDGLDGMAILGEILGDENLLENAKSIIFNAYKEKRLKQYGLSGRVRIFAAYMLGTTKLFLPVMISVNLALIWGMIR